MLSSQKIKDGDQVWWKDRIHTRMGKVLSTNRYWTTVKISDTGIKELDEESIQTKKLSLLEDSE
jgi:hypothetical protein